MTAKNALPFVIRLFNGKVSAGVLQLTLGIAVIVAVLCSSTILLAYYSRLSILHSKIKSDLVDNANSGIQYLMAEHTELPYYESERIDLYGAEVDSVELNRKPWGVFELLSVTAFRGSNHYTRSALITAGTNAETSTALYIPENNAAIYLVGETEITGTVFGPERKFTTGYVNGQGFKGAHLMTGDYQQSSVIMPDFDSTLMYQAGQWLKGEAQSNQKITTLNELPTKGYYPFSNTATFFYHSTGLIEVSDTLQGNLVICSSSKVHVRREAVLRDVIILAPEIEIDQGQHGSAQFFATRYITLQPEATLQYPSSLCLIGKAQDSLISIGKNAKVEGVIIIAGYDQSRESNGLFKIQEDGLLHGMAYINGSSDIQGAIWGHLTTKKVVTTVNGSTYGNHIYNAELNYSKKSPYMPASMVWGARDAEKIVVRWIN